MCAHVGQGRGGETHCVGSQGLPPLFLAPFHFHHRWVGCIGDHVSCNVIVSFCVQTAQRFRIWSASDQTLCEAQRGRQCCEEHHLQSQLCARSFLQQWTVIQKSRSSCQRLEENLWKETWGNLILKYLMQIGKPIASV